MKCSFACLGYTENLPAQLGGKKVFIDLSSCSGVAEKIKNILVKCGAQRTEFLDKHVDAIIVDKRQPREKKNFSNSSCHSRVACMIKKTMGKTISGSSSVEEIGKKWNIPVHDYRAILATNHYDKKKPEECSIKNFKVKKLKAPFIKVEDRTGRYRPNFVEMNTIPFIDFKSQNPKSPFETWFKANAPTSSKGDAIPSRTCELCHGTYSDLDSHLVSKRHTAAANDDSLFEGVDHLIRRGTSLKDFIKKIEDRKKLEKNSDFQS